MRHAVDFILMSYGPSVHIMTPRTSRDELHYLQQINQLRKIYINLSQRGCTQDSVTKHTLMCKQKKISTSQMFQKTVFKKEKKNNIQKGE